jgi:hypothetical protein
MPLMARREAREVKPPAGRAATMAAAREALRPPMCMRRLVEAVLRSTPTWHTADCTTCAGVVGAGRVGGLRGGRGTGRGESGDWEALLCQLMMGEAINAHQSQSAWKLSCAHSASSSLGGHQSQSACKLACANSASSSLGGRSCWYSPTPRDLGSTRTSSAMGSCECERRPSVVVRGHQGSSEVIRGHQRSTEAMRSLTCSRRASEAAPIAAGSSVGSATCMQ